MSKTETQNNTAITGLDIVQSIFRRHMTQDEFDAILQSLSHAEVTKLSSKLVEHTRKLSALVEVTDRMSESISLNELYPRMLALMTQTLNAERSTMFLFDSDTEELFSRSAIDEEGTQFDEIRIPKDTGIAGSVFTSGVSEIIPDAYADDRFNRNVDTATGYQTRNIVCVPVRDKDERVIGVLEVLNKKSGQFNREDCRLLEMVGSQASTALQNGILFEQVERARWEEAKLLEITSALSSELQVHDLLRKIIEVTTNLLDADRSTLFLYDELTNELWSLVAEGLATKEIRLPSNQGLVGECFVSGEALKINDPYNDPRFNKEIDVKTGFQTRNMLCMPILNKDGRKLGVIQVLNKSRGDFNMLDQKRLRSFAAQCAIALENAQLFEDMKATRNFNESILKSMSNGMITLDEEFRITKLNDAAQSVFGIRTENVLEHQLLEIVGEENQWLVESVKRVRESNEQDIALDVEFTRSDSKKVSVNLTVVPLIDDAKEHIIGYLLVIEDLTETKRITSTMSRYLSKEVMDQLMGADLSRLGGVSQNISILFSDIRAFTTISESLGTKGTVKMLNEYFTEMVDEIFANHGILDKYIGDAIMALFGAPFPGPEDSDNALKTACGMIRRLEPLNKKRIAKGTYLIDIGIGIATGEVIAGNIGSPKRMDYTVIGDRVNLASRLEGATKAYGANIIICEATKNSLKQKHLLRALDLLRVKGKTKPIGIYEALGHHTYETFPNLEKCLEAFSKGLLHYRKRDFHGALNSFKDAVRANPNDGPSHVYMERCQHYLENPPKASWDGVWIMDSK